MPAEPPPSLLLRFGRGLAGFGAGLRPAVRPLGYGLLATGTALATGYAVREGINAWTRTYDGRARLENAKNPPLEVVQVDPDPGQRGDEVTAFFDRKTGRTSFFGNEPSGSVGPERSQEREAKLGLVVGGAVALGLGALVLLTRRE